MFWQIQYIPYLPDLALYDIFLFPKLKLNPRVRFEDVKNKKRNTGMQLQWDEVSFSGLSTQGKIAGIDALKS